MPRMQRYQGILGTRSSQELVSDRAGLLKKVHLVQIMLSSIFSVNLLRCRTSELFSAYLYIQTDSYTYIQWHIYDDIWYSKDLRWGATSLWMCCWLCQVRSPSISRSHPYLLYILSSCHIYHRNIINFCLKILELTVYHFSNWSQMCNAGSLLW